MIAVGLMMRLTSRPMQPPQRCRQKHLHVTLTNDQGKRRKRIPARDSESECENARYQRYFSQICTKYAESRADHVLENFGDSPYPYGKYGRHEETRTPDLYRVKVRLTHTYNNFYVLGTAAKPL
jgi:hypothetical protein